ncbi:putative NIMA-related kinase [Trypanosoma rangeli]|uniref:Putative NIMA-related kinase n=1 Tax=Trypanosoma rangeli TaxID=5698 RepID=A0A3R7P1Y4_TRYRA|nr:putative NIMA-related kinase [Trypanosoma rangeli]RNF11442.1 putative NIMA-related kinase [Trypanosoma rangeli]|eukprot:RNF11442.1 putative NIMA-related kinase [Trypanosoma rangeli]
MPSNDSHDSQLLRHYAQFFPNVLFTSEEEMEKYCQEARPDAVRKVLDLPEGEEVPEDVMKDPRAHLYILMHIVGRNATTAAFVALRGSDKQKVVAKFIMLNDEKQAAYARSEVHCLAACDHFGIVKHYDDLKSEDKAATNHGVRQWRRS